MIREKRIGLALSGGGFRAAAFHLGTLKKLNELKLLDKVDVISTISGGSIIGACYALNKDNFDKFYSEFKERLQKCLITRMLLSFRFFLLFCILFGVPILISFLVGFSSSLFSFFVLFLIYLLFFHNIFKTTKLVRRFYDKIFFQNKKLKNLPSKPDLAINTTNLDTGTLMTFSRRKMSDSSYSYPRDGGDRIIFIPDDFPVSLAVAASTAVPYIFNPVKIEKKYFRNPNDKKRVRPFLVDGGVYDNQGIHKITQKKSSYKCDIIICSDGSSPFRKRFLSINPFPILKRIAIEIQMRRIKNLQFIDNVYERANGIIDEIAYFSLDWDYEKCISGFVGAIEEGTLPEKIIVAHKIPEDFYKDKKKIKRNEIKNFIKKKIKYDEIIRNSLSKAERVFISKISTSLRALKNDEIDLLVRHAEVMTELHLRLYCPLLFV